MFSGINHTNFQNNDGKQSILESSPTLTFSITRQGFYPRPPKIENNADTLNIAVSENVAVFTPAFLTVLAKVNAFPPPYYKTTQHRLRSQSLQREINYILTHTSM